MKLKNDVQCRFCAIAAGGADTFDSRWHANSDYAALVSVGALVHGWSLVCPIAHTVNLASQYDKALFWNFVSETAEMMRARFGRCTVFEHGAANEGSATGCGVDHAHLHIVPLEFSLQEASVEASKGELVWQMCEAREIQSKANGQEYLFVADELQGCETKGIICILNQSTSQFFRRVIAKRIGMIDCFDYKIHPMLDVAKSSVVSLREIAADVVEV